MSNLYSAQIAHHYDSYRPGLHSIILKKALGSKQYSNALDVGCGTGLSTTALLPYAEKITGIDPSQSMIARTTSTTSISYKKSTLEEIEGEPERYDLITFAGSFFYALSENLCREVERVLTRNGTVLIYDFHVPPDPASAILSLPEITSEYDHSSNFEGMGCSELKLKKEVRSHTAVTTNPIELAHLILADFPSFEYCKNYYKVDDPFNLLVKDLEELASGNNFTLNAALFWSEYQKL